MSGGMPPVPEERLQRERADFASLLDAFAHAVRNPLSAVQATVETVEQSSRLDSSDQEFLHTAFQKLQEADRMLRSLIALAQAPALRLTALEPGQLLTELSQFVSDRTKRQGVTVHVESAKEVAEVVADRTELGRGLLHLVTNALDAMPQGGRLGLCVESKQENGARWIEFTVADTGSGIPDNHRQRVLTPFFTTKPGAEGLGLAYANRAARLHGGALSFGPAAPNGTVFCLRIPDPKA